MIRIMRNFYTFLLATLLLIFAGSLSAQTITITSPNGGETWTGCTSRTITWTHSGLPNTFFDIDYSPDNGSSWVAVASSLNAPGGTYSWTLPNITSGSFLIRVSLSSNGTINDVSNAVFSNVGALIVNAPNGGESWTAFSSQTISWTPNGTSGTYVIDYSTNNGTTWTNVTPSYPTGGNTYPWSLVPNTPSSQCKVRVSDISDLTCKTDQSNNTFFILSSVNVLTPNGGESWNATVGTQNTLVNMDNVPVTMNTGNFYDYGGPAGTMNGATYTKTFTPDNPLNKLRYAFTSFSVGTGTLSIYNGPTTGSPLIGTYSSTNLPPAFTSSHLTGALTFVVSGGSGNTGWDAVLTSIGTPTRTVNWNVIGTSGKFDLNYSTDNGTSWVPILRNYPSSGTFLWQVPNTPSTNCRFQVKDNTNGAIVDQSDAVFTIGPVTPVIVLDAPNGGQSFYAGTNTTITWRTGFVLNPTIKLEVSTDAGATWSVITGATANTGSYTWTVPPSPSTQCRVRASDASNSTTNDMSDANFTIFPYIAITNPNGGNNLSGCNTQNISFNHGGTSGTFLIDYTTDNGSTWTTITSNYTPGSNPATYTGWQLPNIFSNQCKVRVSDATDPLKTDESNAVFTINQTLNVQIISPNGGQNWITGTSQNIAYTLGGGVTTVLLEYSTNNGSTWTGIVNSTGGLYVWTVPNTPSTQCLVRATDISNPCNSDRSDATFTIISTLTLTAPNGGQTWNATVGPQGTSYNMDNAPITMNTGNFYDAGGPSGTIPSNGTFVKTFTPDNPLNKIR
ncbi:MAG: hypothetical protein RLZZ519_320, partial [Bacteroidota bacterium]